MFNPFQKKTTTFRITCKAFKREFKVTTADGAEYNTTREDFLSTNYYYGGGSFGYSLRSVKAEDVLEYGIEHGIQVEVPDVADTRVQPIKVQLIKRTPITLESFKEIDWYIFKPKKGHFFVPSNMTVEILIGDKVWN